MTVLEKSHIFCKRDQLFHSLHVLKGKDYCNRYSEFQQEISEKYSEET